MNRKTGISLLVILMLLSSVLFPVLQTTLASPNTANVATFSELKTALESKDIEQINLTANITVPKKGAVINPSKASLSINGNGYQLTDYESCCFDDILRLEKAGTLKKISIQDIKVTGRNYYGFLSLDSCIKGVTVSCSNMVYNGPQVTYNRAGKVSYTDCNITIVPGYCNLAGEVAEAYEVVLAGNVKIIKNAPKDCNEIFWITCCAGTAGGITIMPCANVSVNNANNKSGCSGFCYNDSCNGYLTFGANSNFTFDGVNQFYACCSVKNVTVEDSARAVILVDGKLCDPMLCVSGKMDFVGNNYFILAAKNSTSTCPALRIYGSSAVLSIHDPIQVQFYNNTTSTYCTAVAIEFCCPSEKINNHLVSDTGQINYWKSAAGVDCIDPQDPKSRWNNDGLSPFDVDAKFKCDGRVLGLKAQDYTGSYPLTAATYSLEKVKIAQYIRPKAQINVVTGDPLDVTYDAATIINNSYSGITETIYAVGNEYSTDPNLAGSFTKAANAIGTPYAVDLSGLTPDTTYYYRAYVIGNGNTYYGGIKTFTTPKAPICVITGDPSSVTQDSAAIIDNSYSGITETIHEVGNEYSIDPNLAGSHTTAANAIGTPYAVDLSGLTPNTTYYYRAYVKIPGNIYYGQIKNFTTPDIPGIAITGSIKWDDFTNAYGVRPIDVNVELKRNGITIANVIVDASSGWKFTFNNLPEFDSSNNPYVYTVDEPRIPDGYNKSVDNTTYTITNTLRTIKLTTIYWDDKENMEIARETKYVPYNSNQIVTSPALSNYVAKPPTTHVFMNLRDDETFWTFHYDPK